MRMLEQVDTTAGRTPTYSWIVDCIRKATGVKKLPGWRWTRGNPGCFVTNDQALAEQTKAQFGLTVESNGTHASSNNPQLL